MLEVFRIEANWDGHRLEVRPIYGGGWELLAGEARPIGKRHSIPAIDVNSLTSFQLEAALYTAMREIGDCWDVAQRAEEQLKLRLEAAADEGV